MSDVERWAEYFRAALAAAGYTGRGWKSRLARDIGFHNVVVGRWDTGTRVPDVESCKRLAQVFDRPLAEVLVAAGHAAPGELGVEVVPAWTGPVESIDRVSEWARTDASLTALERERVLVLAGLIRDIAERRVDDSGA